MKERYQLLGFMLVVSIALWYGVIRFMGSTNEFAGELNTRTMAYLETNDESPLDVVEKPAVQINNTKLPPTVSTPQAQQAPVLSANRAPASQASVTASSNSKVVDTTATQAKRKAPTERADSDQDIATQKAVNAAAQSVIVKQPELQQKLMPIDKYKLPAMQEQELLAAIDEDLLKGPAATRAVDIRLMLAKRDCPMSAQERTRIGVLFRHGSAAIKGASLNLIDGLIHLHRRCGGTFELKHNPQGTTDANDVLKKRRQDEVKYYFLQRSIPKTDIEFSENL